MPRSSLEVADIFRDHGDAFRKANCGRISLDQLKIMSASERCRTAILGGHVTRCADCAHEHIAYNSCRNRHYEFLGNGSRAASIARIRELFGFKATDHGYKGKEEPVGSTDDQPRIIALPSPCCGG